MVRRGSNTVFEWIGVDVAGGYDAFEKEDALGLKLVWAKVAGKVFANKNGVSKFGGHLFKANGEGDGAP